MAAVASEAFCECLGQKLPVAINFVDYVGIITRTKEELKYSTLSAEDKGVVDITRKARDQCVGQVASPAAAEGSRRVRDNKAGNNRRWRRSSNPRNGRARSQQEASRNSAQSLNLAVAALVLTPRSRQRLQRRLLFRLVAVGWRATFTTVGRPHPFPRL